jgi:hypothetical protein
MRKLVCLLPAAAAVLLLPAAQAVRAPAVSLSVSSFQVRYGDPVRLSGRVASHRAGVRIEVFSQPFTNSKFGRIATVTTVADGRWHFAARPAIATAYQARAGGGESRTLLVGVRPAVSLVWLDSGRLRVKVGGGSSFAGKAVKVQQLDSGSWSTLAKLRLNGKSRVLVPSSIVPLRRSTLRATMSVNQAGPGYLGGFSQPLILPVRWVSLSLSSSEVVFGDALRLSGRVSLKQDGMRLSILARPAAKPEFQELATLKTSVGGRWSLRVRPRIGTVYAARFAGATSRDLGVGVHPRATARILSRARVWTRVTAGRSLKGRSVKMQQLSEGQWRTIAKRPLNSRSVAVFPASILPGGTSTLRIAMSVNQAGTGYLGTSSRPFVYQR